MAEVLTGDGIRAVQFPVGGNALVCGFLARPWTTSNGGTRLVAADDPILVLVLVPYVIVPLVRLTTATAAANPDLRRWFTADHVPVDVRVNVDVAIAIGRCVIVGLNGAQSDLEARRPASVISVILLLVKRARTCITA